MKEEITTGNNWRSKLLRLLRREKKPNTGKQYEQSVLFKDEKTTGVYNSNPKPRLDFDKAEETLLTEEIKRQLGKYRENNEGLVRIPRADLNVLMRQIIPLKSSPEAIYQVIDIFYKKAAQELRQLIQDQLKVYYQSRKNNRFDAIQIKEEELIATIAPFLYLKNSKEGLVTAVGHLIQLYGKAKEGLIEYLSDSKNPYSQCINEVGLIQALFTKIGVIESPIHMSGCIRDYCKKEIKLNKIQNRFNEYIKHGRYRKLKIDTEDLILTIAPKININTDDSEITKLIHQYYRSRQKLIKALDKKLESFISEKNKSHFPCLDTDTKRIEFRSTLLSKINGTTDLNELDYLINETYKGLTYRSGALNGVPWFHVNDPKGSASSIVNPDSSVSSQPRRKTANCLPRTRLSDCIRSAIPRRRTL